MSTNHLLIDGFESQNYYFISSKSKEAKYVLQVCAFLAYQGFFVVHLIYLAVL